MGIFLGVLIHELGHMLGGIPAGMKASVFRIGRLMLAESPGGHMRLQISDERGLSGQCLLKRRRMRTCADSAARTQAGRITLRQAAAALLGGAAANLIFFAGSAAAMFVLYFPGARQSAAGTVSVLLLFDLAFWNLADFMSAAVPGNGNDMSVFLELARRPALIPAYFEIMELAAQKLKGAMSMRRFLRCHELILENEPRGLLMENLLALAPENEGEVDYEPARKAS